MVSKWISTVLAVCFFLISCGGGPGVPAIGLPSTSGGAKNGADVAPVPAPTLKLSLRDSAGAPTNSIGITGATAEAVLSDVDGVPIANKRISFSTDAASAAVSPSSVLTDSNGVAVVRITPATATATGAGTLTATGSVGTTILTKAIDFGVAAPNLKLQPIAVGESNLPAYGNRALSVGVLADGKPVSFPVAVTFTASCGMLKPASITTNVVGVATTVYSAADATCFGSTVVFSAAVSGAPAVSGQVAVLPPAATNIQFVSATPSTIYLSASTGATQALVTFKAVDNTGAAIANKAVTLALANAGSGVSIDSPGNSLPVTKTTDAQGAVTVAVFAGSIPTSVQVTATANGVAPTSSNILTVASGRPDQRSMSISLGQFAIEGANVDGVTTSVNVSFADRQGNPVPDGTQVNFTSESGVLTPATCVISNGTSSCVVDIRSQGTRPLDGRVSILAYLPGDEEFQDVNSNNFYDFGEPFADLGDAYRDDNEDGTFNPGEFTVPRASGGCSAMLPDARFSIAERGRTGRCDGVWGASEVRRQGVVVFATSSAKIVSLSSTGRDVLNLSGAAVYITDQNDNQMPPGTSISITSTTEGCGVTSLVSKVLDEYFSLTQVREGLAGTTVPMQFKGCPAKGKVTVKVTSPRGVETSKEFEIES